MSCYDISFNISCDNSGGEYYCSDDEDYTCPSGNYSTSCGYEYAPNASYPPPPYAPSPYPSPYPPPYMPPPYCPPAYPPATSYAQPTNYPSGYIKYPITNTTYNPCYTPAYKKATYALGYLPPVCQTGCPCPSTYSSSSCIGKCYKKLYCNPSYSQCAPTNYKSTYTYKACDTSCSCSYSQANYNNKH